MTPILATKLYLPPLRPNEVSRPRLIERLNEGLHRKLTLISAPAGFGKTTLVTQWIASIKSPAIWLALDEGDNDLRRFLTYLIAALQTLAPSIGEEALGLLQSSQSPPETILTALLNEIAALPEHFVLIFDDYHVIEAPAIDQAVAFLIEHLPPQMHLATTTREDPRLPLARLRARGHLTELRAADLRFTTSEASAFLSQGMKLCLSETDVVRLAERTEGWIAGLQLAALSMQGHQDIPGFIRTFAGDHRYIVDYLLEEVLQHQPETVRNFLLWTSILDRLSGPLCDAVTGQENGGARLEDLEGGNFFVVPLDDQRRWYRYHHLFAEVLSARLLAEQPAQIATLHQRASEWYERNGSINDAIRHALAASAFERAANLIELTIPAVRRERREAVLLAWLKVLPDKVISFRPVLNVGYAWALLASGELEAAHTRLLEAERQLETTITPAAEMVVVDGEEFRHLPALIAVYHAALAQALGDMPNVVKYASRALELLPQDDPLGRGAATALLGLAAWTNGDLETAYRGFADGLAVVQIAGNLSDAINGTLALADIRIAQGRLREATRLYERSLQKALAQGEPLPRGTADLYVGMSDLCREQNNLPMALEYLEKSQELGEHVSLAPNRHRWYIAMARIREIQGDLDIALDLLHEAERLYRRETFPNVRPVSALLVRALIAQGKLDQASVWTREQGLTASDKLSYMREFEHITLARLLLARAKSDRAGNSLHEARGLLERLLTAARAGERAGSILEILLLLALTSQQQSDIPTALKLLQEALALAEPEGYVRIFLDEGSPLALLLQEAAKRGIAPHYVRQLLTAFGAIPERASTKQELLEPLSERELAVLRLLGTDLSGPEIASELVVSLNTMRTHTKNIYSKLGVSTRRAALRRAEELGLF